MEPKHWQRLRRGLEHDYRVLRVREDRFLHPRTGEDHPRVIVTCSDWVNVLAYTGAGEVVLVRQWRAGVGHNTLELPGGIIDPGEDPAHAALRELAEETGYVGERAEPLGWTHPNPANLTNRCYSFLVRDARQVDAQRLDAGEDIQVVVLGREALREAILRQEFTHALALNALLLERLRAEAP